MATCGFNNDGFLLLVLSISFFDVETRAFLFRFIFFVGLEDFANISDHVRKLAVSLELFLVLIDPSLQVISLLLSTSEVGLLIPDLHLHIVYALLDLVISHSRKRSHDLQLVRKVSKNLVKTDCTLTILNFLHGKRVTYLLFFGLRILFLSSRGWWLYLFGFLVN